MTSSVWDRTPPRPRWTQALCAALGFATFWPVGITYLLMLVLISFVLLQRSKWQERWKGLRSYAALAILVFAVLWPAMTLMWHPLFNDTGTRLFHIMRVSAVLLVGLLLLPEERRWALAGFVVGAVVAAAIISVHSIYPLPDWDPWKHLLLRSAHNASQKMVAMASAAAMLWVLLWHRPWAWHIKLMCVLAALWMGIIVLAHGSSRNAYLLVVILPVALMFYQLRKVRLWLYATVTVAAIVLVVAQLKPQSFTQVQTSLAKLTRTTDLDVSEGSMTLRVKQWRTAIEQFQQHPAQGAGLGSWRSIWSKTPYLPLDSSNRSLNNPHNDYLLNAAETGVLGLLSIVAILGWFAWRSWRMNSLWGAAAFCLTCAVAVTAAVNAPFRDGGFGMSLMWLMAAATAASYSSVVARSSA